MDQVRIARFIDLQEAQIAAGMLQSNGLAVYLQNENMGAIDFLIRQAIGGFGLWVPENEAEEARRILKKVEAGEEALEPEADSEPVVEQPGRLYGIALAILGLFSWTLALIVRRRGLPGSMSLSGFVAASVLVLVTIVAVMIAADLIGRPHPY